MDEGRSGDDPGLEPVSYRAAVIVPGDVIELDGHPWVVRHAHTGTATRTLTLVRETSTVGDAYVAEGHPRTIRPSLDTMITVLRPRTPNTP